MPSEEQNPVTSDRISIHDRHCCYHVSLFPSGSRTHRRISWRRCSGILLRIFLLPFLPARKRIVALMSMGIVVRKIAPLLAGQVDGSGRCCREPGSSGMRSRCSGVIMGQTNLQRNLRDSAYNRSSRLQQSHRGRDSVETIAERTGARCSEPGFNPAGECRPAECRYPGACGARARRLCLPARMFRFL